MKKAWHGTTRPRTREEQASMAELLARVKEKREQATKGSTTHEDAPQSTNGKRARGQGAQGSFRKTKTVGL